MSGRMGICHLNFGKNFVYLVNGTENTFRDLVSIANDMLVFETIYILIYLLIMVTNKTLYLNKLYLKPDLQIAGLQSLSQVFKKL